MTKNKLMSLLFAPENTTAIISGVKGRIISIEREDGSGRCFNVRMWSDWDKKAVNVFVRTID